MGCRRGQPWRDYDGGGKKSGCLRRIAGLNGADGKLIRIGHGVYKLAKHARGELDEYAEAVALVGKTGFIRGASSLMMRGLVPYDPAAMRLGVSRRVRRRLPRTYDVRYKPSPDVELVEGIPAEKVGNALEDARKTGALDADRLEEVEAAQKRLDAALGIW